MIILPILTGRMYVIFEPGSERVSSDNAHVRGRLVSRTCNHRRGVLCVKARVRLCLLWPVDTFGSTRTPRSWTFSPPYRLCVQLETSGEAELIRLCVVSYPDPDHLGGRLGRPGYRVPAEGIRLRFNCAGQFDLGGGGWGREKEREGERGREKVVGEEGRGYLARERMKNAEIVKLTGTKFGDNLVYHNFNGK